MIIASNELEGATVERVYWAVPSRDWLPVIGDKFDTFRDAMDHADAVMDRTGKERLTITSRIIFRKTNGTTVDMEIDREVRFR